MFIYLFLFLLQLIVNTAEVSFFIDQSLQEMIRGVDGPYTQQINIYSPQFYLSDRVRINTNFMIGSSQKVLYLNYPFTFANDSVNNSMKNSNSSGIIILKDQPAGVTAANLINQTSIVPIAYFTLQQAPIGWSLYSPADYYQQQTAVTEISLYNNNIYIGRSSGPTHAIDNFYNNNIGSYFNKSGLYNVILGNNSGNYKNDKLLSYNTIVGCMSGNLITGSFNSFFGDYHGDKKILNANYLNQDYYANNDFSNYNNSFGFGNYNLTHSTSQGLKFLANKQNNVFGNLNFSSIWRGYRNCIFGNRILTTNIDNITQFSWIDSNIMIGNNILYEYNNNLINGLYGNIILVPNGDKAIYGGIDLSQAFGPNTNNTGAQSNYTIMIGSCGLPIPYQRSYKTFIANIYNSSLIQTGAPLSTSTVKTQTLGNMGATTFPVTVMINNADQLGQMELVPYRNFKLEGYNPNAEPGNVTNLDYVVNFLLDPDAMPVIGVAFENTTESTKNGLLFTVDAYSLINNASILSGNPLSSFVIYTTPKEPVPYSQATGKPTTNVISANTSDATVTGYEHYYLIPLLVRACQIMNTKIQMISNTNIVCGDLIAASNPGQTVTLGNNTGTITIASINITKPTINTNFNSLMVNSQGQMTTGIITQTINSVGSEINIAGSLNLTGYINCTEVILGLQNGNFLLFDNNSGPNIDVLLQAKKNINSKLLLSANRNIVISSPTITPPISGTSPLLIAQDGSITTLSSSQRYKKNIKLCNITEEDIDQLKPISFEYLNNNNTGVHYGFLAEDIYNIESLKNTVIINHNNQIESINYNSLFVAIFSYFLKIQKKLKARYDEIEVDYNNLNTKYDHIKNELAIKNNQIQELQEKYDYLKNLISSLLLEKNN